MNEAIATRAIDNPGTTDNGEDNVITDVTRPRGSTSDEQRHRKWKQNLRLELIREHFEAQEKSSATRKPVLLQMLDLSENR